MSFITTVEHAYAVAIGDLKKMGATVSNIVVPALQKAHADAPIIETITGLVSPQIANIERTADALLGVVIKAIDDAQAAGKAGLTDLTLDGSLIADIKAIMPLIKSTAAPAVAAAKAAPAA